MLSDGIKIKYYRLSGQAMSPQAMIYTSWFKKLYLEHSRR